MKFVNNCIYRAEAENCCEKNGQYCPKHAEQDDLPCGGVCYRQKEEDDE